MKTEIVLYPTLRRAFYEWNRLAYTYIVIDEFEVEPQESEDKEEE